ncbi:MAG: Gfo/Idh/MocA family protein [Bacteriovoracaceae bacterium]
MKVLFCGQGSIGKRHARLLSLDKNFDLYALRTGSVSSEGFCKEMRSWEEVESLKPEFAFITNPTSLHIETAIKLAKLGVHLFIEKPLDMNDSSLQELISLVDEKNLVTYVAYNLRFHPVIQKLKELTEHQKVIFLKATSSSYLPNWRPGQDHKKSYSAHSEMGGGVVLDLSHEIDYVSYLLGTVYDIKGNYGRAADITVTSEDFANMLISAQKGQALIHLNYFSQRTSRIVEIDFQDFTAIGDLINGTVEIYKNGQKLESFRYEVDRDYTYIKQLEYFTANFKNPNMMNNVKECSGLFKKMIKFKKEYHG